MHFRQVNQVVLIQSFGRSHALFWNHIQITFKADVLCRLAHSLLKSNREQFAMLPVSGLYLVILVG